MKRDLDVVLRILEYLEEREETSVITQLEIPGYDSRILAYHCRRMYEGGLLDAEAVVSSTTSSRLIDVLPFGLTWEGHEFLDAMRKGTISAKVRQRLGGTLANTPFVLVRELALAIGREQLGLTV